MRDFFIGALDKLIAVLVILMIIGVVVGAIMTAMSPMGGALQAVAIVVGGALYVILTAGMLYLFLGIYHNTKRTAEILQNRG